MTEFMISGIRNDKLRTKITKINNAYIDAVAKSLLEVIPSNKNQNSKELAAILLAAGQGLMLVYYGNPTKGHRKLTEQAIKNLFMILI